VVVEWLAGGLIAYRHREDIHHMLNTGLKAFFGTKTHLAFTGMQGIGKSVLLDHLTGAAFKKGYQIPLQSQSLEKGKIASGKQRIRVAVVPGQDAQPRLEGLDKLFGGKRGVQGVVHVVGNGFASVRTPGAIQILVRDLKLTTIKKYREHQLKEELKDLDQTCEAIRAARPARGGPKWMIVAVGKADLYQDTMDKARQHYSPEGDSPFAERLARLLSQVGADNFRWTAVPVCSLVEAFEWNNKQVAPHIDLAARDAYLAQFLREMREYCKQ
jgi:hypothetical protein